MFKHDHLLRLERRHYVRLDSVFPVQFRIFSLDNKYGLSDWQQGFTNNIGKGGICLLVNNFKPEFVELIKNQQAKLSLDMEMPLSARPVSASCKVAWVKDLESPGKYIIGLTYENMEPTTNNRIMRYVWTKKLFVPLLMAIILILGLGFIIGGYLNMRLIQKNKSLVEQLIKILSESGTAKQSIKELSREREGLHSKIQALQSDIQKAEEEKMALAEKAKLEEAATAQGTEELNGLIKNLLQEKAFLQEQLMSVQRKENAITEELLRLEKKKTNLEKANLDKMYQWLTIHQNPRTGLVISFEGDNDIDNWAFTYDQSLVTQAYTNFSDFSRARKILDFFAKKAQRKEALFYNAYYANDGEPAEYVVHSGPNIWIGIAILQYTQKSRDTNYLKLAEDIASGIIALQNQDSEGGLHGGPNIEWYSSEHNLDAYAFFNMLYETTKKNNYLLARDKILNWLVQHTYDRADIPIKRGKGDSTIATDTYAWSIAAIGPEKLLSLEMNPDKIMEFAESNCSVEVSYGRPKGQSVKIKGFDFAPKKHLARGGIVSSEWTAQMVISFKIMADYYYKKNTLARAKEYELKANEYLAGLGNMIISSPSPSGQGESCLPYATQDFVDTGHGWMTPKGKSTGSLAGTAYTLFAYYNYNPLYLSNDQKS